MAQLSIIKMGHPHLRKKTARVSTDEFKSAEFQQFIDELIETMKIAGGVGIAAPQVNVLKQVFIMESQNNERYPDRDAFELRVVINPTIEFLTNEEVDSWEGCLSIPGIRGKLSRHKTIRLTGKNRFGEPFEQELTGFEAIVAQHEHDHLNGILFIDRMENMKTLSFQAEYDEFKGCLG